MSFFKTQIPAVQCPLCSSTKTRELCEVGGFFIWRCPQCCTDFVFPSPVETVLKNIYDQEAWFEGDERSGYYNYDEQTAPLIAPFDALLLKLRPQSGEPSILDIGCGYGTHLAAAARQGWNCFGVEVSGHARKVLQERYPDSIFVAESIRQLMPRRFDVVLMLDSFEHMPEPVQALYDLFRLGAIGPKTQLVITTPNSRSYDAVRDPASWKYRHPPSHLFFYSAESLVRLFRRLHFQHIEVIGIHPPPESPECRGYSDEDSALNNSLMRFAGVQCIASGSDLAEFMGKHYVPGVWSKPDEFVESSVDYAQIVKAVEEMLHREQIARYELHQYSARVQGQLDERVREVNSYEHMVLELNRKHGEVVIELNRELETTRQELAASNQDIAHIKGSKMYRLRDAWHEPISVHKFARIGYLMAAILSPIGPPKALRPIIDRLKSRLNPPSPPPPPPTPRRKDEERLISPVPAVAEKIEHVSVVIPTKNAGPEFRELLLRLLQQDFPGTLDVLVVDSGSQDETVKLGWQYGAQVLSIDPASFDHGRTRNLGAKSVRGEVVVFLTQDALPGDLHLIANLVRPFCDPLVAGVHGRQVPRPDADTITRRRLNSWLTGSPTPHVRWLETLEQYDRLTPLERYHFCNFDNVCSAIRRDVLMQLPFPASNFGEDITWGKKALIAGWKLAYEPDAWVIHSHRRFLAYEYRRSYDSHRRLFELFDLEIVPSLGHVARVASVVAWDDLQYLWGQNFKVE